MTAQQIAEALGGATRIADGWKARCPAHEDRTPSLSIADAEDGRLLVRCHAGCEQSSVWSALKERGLLNGHAKEFSASPASAPIQARKVEIRIGRPPANAPVPAMVDARLGKPAASWCYRDTDGGVLYYVARYDSRDGKQVKPWAFDVDAGAWVCRAYPRPRPLYGLDRLAANPASPVLIVEGEKCADAARDAGYVVMTWCGGSNAVTSADWSAIKGRDVTIWPDADEPGKKAAAQIQDILGHCKVLAVDGQPDGWDVADAVADGWPPARVLEFIEQRLPKDPDPAETPHDSRIVLTRAVDAAAKPHRSAWLLRPYLERNVLALMYGSLGTMKSFLALLWSWELAERGMPVVYLSAEGKGMWKRLRGLAIARQADLGTLPLWVLERPVDLSNAAGIEAIAAAIEATGQRPVLIVVDTLSRNSGAADEDKAADMTPFLNGLDAGLRIRFGASVLLVHHVGHMEKKRARGSYVLMANTDANFLVERPSADLLIEVTTGRLKDTESPPPASYRARVVELGTEDEDGEPETTLVLVPTEDRPVRPMSRPSGKNQVAALDAIVRAIRSGKTMLQAEACRHVQTECEFDRNRAHEVVQSLIKGGFLKIGAMGPLEIGGEQ